MCHWLLVIINVTQPANISFLQLTPNHKRYKITQLALQKMVTGPFSLFFDDAREIKVGFAHYSFHSESTLNMQYYNKLLHLREEGSTHHFKDKLSMQNF